MKLYLAYEQGVTCGGKPESQHGACLIASLTDTGTSGADPQSAGGDNTSGAFKCGASFGDPAATPGGTFSYFDDAVSRQASILNPYNENFSWTYLANGWISQQNNGPAATSYTLNARGLLTDLRTTPIGQPNVTLSEFSNITWNDVLQRTGMTVSLPAAPAFGGQTTETYAGQNELQQEQSTRNGGYTEAFGYDGAENATTFKGALQSFNADNQNSADVWDGNGSPTTYSGIACSYDPESRLTASGATLTAGYTGAGLRAWKQTTAGRTYFLYDLDDQPICEVNSAGAVTAVTTFSDNGLLARHTSSGSVFYTFDPSGSVCQRLDSNANVLTTCLFDAYGTRSCTDADTDPYAGFGGQWGYYTDGETGLALLGHRYYDPSEGRFLTRDPASFDGGINLYSYCTDDPIDGSDPDGYFNARQVSQIERQATKCGWSTRKGNDGVLCQKPGHGMVTIPNVHGGSGSTGCKTFAAEQRELQACCQPEDPKPQPVPVPQPEPGKQKNRGRIVRKCLVVGGETGAVVCGCYVVYRCIRMIPSIAFPPLWPTIPANALCP